MEYFFNQQWAAHGFVEFQRLTGSAADSPLVIQRGSPNQITFGLGATYAFVTHPWWSARCAGVLASFSPRHKSQPLEQVHILLVFKKRSMQRGYQPLGIAFAQRFD